jgi:hypothetical protein
MSTNAGRNALEIPVSPRLPSSTAEYDRRFTDEFNRVLAVYFRQLDAANAALLGRQGGKYLNVPHGAFSNSATQSFAAANTPYVVVLNTSSFSNAVSLASNRITVQQPGVYNVQFSFQFENTNTAIADVWIWLRKNGTDVPDTASTLDVDGTHGGVNGYALAAANFFVNMAANDYLEVIGASSATGVNIEAYTASVSPFTRPSIPSSVVTVSFVSTPAT